MPFIIYRNQEIPQIREKRMTFLFPESVLAFIELQPQEKLFNFQMWQEHKSSRVNPNLH